MLRLLRVLKAQCGQEASDVGRLRQNERHLIINGKHDSRISPCRVGKRRFYHQRRCWRSVLARVLKMMHTTTRITRAVGPERTIRSAEQRGGDLLLSLLTADASSLASLSRAACARLCMLTPPQTQCISRGLPSVIRWSFKMQRTN